MKIFFNLKPPSGSYGGGSFFVKDLAEYLCGKGYIITYKLDKDIDIIMMIDPRKGRLKTYGVHELLSYKKDVNPTVKIIYPVNECDKKRARPKNIEKIILYSIKNVDCVVYISNWLRDYYHAKYPETKSIESFVINNCCNKKYFYPKENKENKSLDKNKIKLVTHHWSNDYNKGFGIYNKLDQIIDKIDWLEFTYIGRYIRNYHPKNIKRIDPISENTLGDELRKYDIYLTASLYEPGGIHQLEGMASGMPVLYVKNGGGIKETIFGCGEEYVDIEDLFVKLKKIINNYDKYRNKINYPFLYSERFGKEYYELINSL